VRRKEGRDEGPSAAVIDSQSIKTSAVRGPEKGFDKGKLIWGRKRHALVDTQGNLMAVKVTAASTSNLQGGKKLLEPLKSLFPRMKLLWGNSHYGGSLIQWLENQLGWKVDVEHDLGTVPDTDTEPSEPQKTSSKGGFKVQPIFWVVERSFAWITR
jgi:putative transposase